MFTVKNNRTPDYPFPSRIDKEGQNDSVATQPCDVTQDDSHKNNTNYARLSVPFPRTQMGRLMA